MSDEVHISKVQQKIPGNRCPKCGGNAEGGTAFKIGEPPPRLPEAGDFAICLYCGSLNVYDEQLKLRMATAGEHKEIARDPVMRRTLEIAQIAAQKKRRGWQ